MLSAFEVHAFFPLPAKFNECKMFLYCKFIKKKFLHEKSCYIAQIYDALNVSLKDYTVYSQKPISMSF